MTARRLRRTLRPFHVPAFIPAPLDTLKQWIGWREAWKPGKSKPDKLPAKAADGEGDGFLTVQGQSSYEEALSAVNVFHLSGVGFVMMDNEIVGGDLDQCRDPATGKLEAWAQEIVDLAETYAEITPSGKGVRFFALGELPDKRAAIKYDPAHVELYVSGRFLTFTGDHIPTTPRRLRPAPETIKALVARVVETRARDGKAERPTSGGDALDFRAWSYRQTPMGRINQAALQNLDSWVLELFPGAERYHNGWRVSSASLGRGLQEDISILPDKGAKDFGEHDMGDPREGRRTPIDLVLEWEPFITNAQEAAQWLAKRIGVPFEDGADTTDSEPGALDPDADLWTQWRAALDRLRQATPRPEFVTGGGVEGAGGTILFDPSYDGPVAVRPGITDRLTRGFVSMVSSAANVGKSTYLGAEAMMVALENGALLGQTTIDWCGPILIVSNEESGAAIVARWRGQMRACGVTAADFRHRLEIWPTDRVKLRIGRLDGSSGAVSPTLDGIGLVIGLAERAEAGQPVALLGMDTLTSLNDGIPENSELMDKAIGLLSAIAEAGFLAVDVMHHQGKSGPTESTTSFRGSSSIFAALAEMSTLSFLEPQEIENLKLSPAQAKRTLRLKGQRQRDGAVPGVWYFEREILAMAAQDPRDTEVAAIKTVATLKAIAPPIAPTAGGDDAHDLLWNEQQGGRQIRRGGQGSRNPDAAQTILMAVLGWSSARAREKVDELIEAKLVIVRLAKDPKGHSVAFLEVVKPANVEDGIF